MTLSISIDPDPHGSDHSLSDEDSGVHVSIPSEGSHDYPDYDEWAHLPYPHELNPSDSASRPRPSRSRPLHGSRSASGRRPTSQRMIPERDFVPRGRRQQSPDSPDSVESDEFTPHSHYDRPPPDRRGWPPTATGPAYAHSQSSGPSYNAYPPAPGHPPYAHPNPQITSDLMRIGHPNQAQPPLWDTFALRVQSSVSTPSWLSYTSFLPRSIPTTAYASPATSAAERFAQSTGAYATPHGAPWRPQPLWGISFPVA
ncbi:hypothetical protein N7508_005672 [Penicillium antarcticum]|uniref:uncharacterized protein n=1 Tax=Penicillium antarcticum TaxID=416450 RepID=UPI002397BE37|nr:uncharacterized protein N7508_005672 [Penicillium antarcticum]KAJ5306657.1 hypothetical protein N7508_005672 [Penicillium antarcticum]